jgi:prepilin-type N-terminal cleavage/methylation domain-containing protein
MRSKQSGFTLVEIAIVLVIIGLLLGGVLKGQELINSAKVKNMINDFRTVSSLVYSYQDRFKAFPGDQLQAQLDSAFGSGNGTQCTLTANLCVPGNARLDGDWNSTTTGKSRLRLTHETFVFWQHVRLANLATGATATNDPTSRTEKRRRWSIGVESGLDSSGAAAPFIQGMRGSFYVCSGGILGRYVRQIDTTMDDGNTAGGNVRAVAANATRNATAIETSNINEGQQYIVCAAF